MRTKKGMKVKVKETAMWTDMSPRTRGEAIPAEHRGEVGVVIDHTDGCPDVEFPDGSWAGYKAEDVEPQ